jgi:hypothetical protein
MAIGDAVEGRSKTEWMWEVGLRFVIYTVTRRRVAGNEEDGKEVYILRAHHKPERPRCGREGLGERLDWIQGNFGQGENQSRGP